MAEDPLVEILRRVRVLERYVEDSRRLDHYITPIADYLLMPGLRGFWPLSSVSEAAAAVQDMSEQGRALTVNGGAGWSTHNLILPFFDFNGSTQYLSRADEAGLSITGGMSIGCVVWMDSVASQQFILCKDNPTGNQRSYALQFVSGGFSFHVSGNGSALINIASSGITINTGQWYFIVGRYTPSTEVVLFVNNQKFTNTTSIPASIFDSTADFRIGSRGDSLTFLDGRVALPFLTTWSAPDEYWSHLLQRTRGLFGI